MKTTPRLRRHVGALLATLGIAAVAASLLADPVRGQSLSIGRPEFIGLVAGLILLVFSAPRVRRAIAGLRVDASKETAAQDALAAQPVRLLLYSAWFAAITSLTGIVLRLCEAGLGWRIHSLSVFWKIPVAYFSILILLGAVLTLLARRGAVRFGLRAVTVCGFAVWLTATLLITAPGLLDLAVMFFAVGASVQFARVAVRHVHGLHLVARSTVVPLLAVCVLVTGGSFAWPLLQERMAIARLPPASGSAPNVLLIVLDTVRADSMSLYGYTRQTTPHLDRFAARGVVFERAMSTAPWTLPSHGSMFTGYYPHAFRSGWSVPLDSKQQTIAEALGANGYMTAGFVGNFIYGGAEYGLGRGFAHYEDHRASWTTALAATAIGRELIDRFRDSEWLDVERPERKTGADITDGFLDWLGERDTARPYFAFLNYFDTHAPYDAPEDHRLQFSDAVNHRNPWTRGLNHWTAEDIRGFRDSYDDALSYLDLQVGRLLTTLEQQRKLENTIVIITADHGEHLGEHGLLDHSSSLYMPLLHVPLIVVYPARLPAGLRISEPVTLRNLPRTILALTGMGSGSSIPGTPLFDPRTGSIAKIDEPLLSETDRTTGAYPTTFPARNGRMKSIVFEGMHFIRNFGTGREELYDLHADFDEGDDLSTSRPDAVARYRKRLELTR